MPNVVLQTEKLTKSYGSLAAVKNLTLEVYEGEVFGFLGPNGAGKTTSINMICGLLKPDAGQVIVFGVPIVNDDNSIRAHVGVCPQNIVLWGRLTCLEQLQFIGQMYGLKGRDARQRGAHLLEELNLLDKRNRQAHTLSGGIQRRLNLAMALVHDPDIVVLDEPEAGLDPQSRVQVREYIKSLARKKTVILTTHNMDEADRVADRVAIIDHGGLLVLDTPAALKRRVGEGDVLEIGLNGDTTVGETACAALARLVHPSTVQFAHDTLTIRTLNAVAMLPALIEALSRASLQVGEVRLRENTLEDVFIQLTGRRLRE
ncbi:MAG: ABC transporter ATP-binding protein [Spirochaetota bacterium]